MLYCSGHIFSNEEVCLLPQGCLSSFTTGLEMISNELVNWFNMIDATYRSDLRDLNDRNFERFESELGRRLAELEGRLRKEVTEQVASLRVEMAQQGTAVRAEMTTLTRWMIGLWAAQITAFIGTVLVVLQR